MGELRETAYQFTAPYVMESSAITAAYGLEPSPWEDVCRRTVRAGSLSALPVQARTGRRPVPGRAAHGAARLRCRGAASAACRLSRVRGRGGSASVARRGAARTATTASANPRREGGRWWRARPRGREAVDQPPVLQPTDYVRQPRQGRVGALASAVIGRVRSGASESIARTKYSKCVSSASAAQLGIQNPGQQLEDRHQPHPSRPLVLVQPFGGHGPIVVKYLSLQLYCVYVSVVATTN